MYSRVAVHQSAIGQLVNVQVGHLAVLLYLE